MGPIKNNKSDRLSFKSLMCKLQENTEGDCNVPDHVEFVNLIQNIFELKSISVKNFVTFCYKLMPRLEVPIIVIENMLGLVIRHMFAPDFSIKQLLCILEWYRGLLIYNVIDKREVAFLYTFYYKLLENDKFVKIALHLIYLTTTTENLNQCLIDRLIATVQAKNGRKYFKAVVLLFDRLQSGHSPYNEEIDHKKYFGKIPKELVESLELFKMRRENHGRIQNAAPNQSLVLSDLSCYSLEKLKNFWKGCSEYDRLLESKAAKFMIILSSNEIKTAITNCIEKDALCKIFSAS